MIRKTTCIYSMKEKLIYLLISIRIYTTFKIQCVFYKSVVLLSCFKWLTWFCSTSVFICSVYVVGLQVLSLSHGEDTQYHRVSLWSSGSLTSPSEWNSSRPSSRPPSRGAPRNSRYGSLQGSTSGHIGSLQESTPGHIGSLQGVNTRSYGVITGVQHQVTWIYMYMVITGGSKSSYLIYMKISEMLDIHEDSTRGFFCCAVWLR